ncbi:MAG: hypothetical protein JWL75_712 [Parcubacteria group bacterium]|nr:hypothetical protein [Parcubacteria group bacterium]
MKIYVAHAGDFDYENKLYIPIKASNLAKEHEFFLPHEKENDFNTKEVIKTVDLLVADISQPSTGVGMEIGRAEAAGVSVLFVSEKGAKISTSLNYVSDQFIEYEDSNDLIAKLREYISSR